MFLDESRATKTKGSVKQAAPAAVPAEVAPVAAAAAAAAPAPASDDDDDVADIFGFGI